MPSFNKLGIAIFISGYLEMISTYDSSVKNSMYDFLKVLMDKAVYYSWPSVRSVYAFCVRQVELGKFNGFLAQFLGLFIFHFLGSICLLLQTRDGPQYNGGIAAHCVLVGCCIK